MNTYTHELNVAKSIARMAGAIMLEYFDVDHYKNIKSDGTPLTIADIQINAMTIRELRARENMGRGVVGSVILSMGPRDTLGVRLLRCSRWALSWMDRR
jgi:hypothetical protein